MSVKVFEKIKEQTLEDGTKTREIQTIVLGNPRHDKNFVKVFPAFFTSALSDVSSGALRLFLWFVGHVIELKANQEPLVLADLKEMAEVLKVSERSVQNYLAELIEKNWIFRKKKSDGRIYPGAYLINPEYVYKGSQRKFFSEQMKMF